MSRSHSAINTLLIVVAIMAVLGGLAIVMVTSPQSWQLGPMAWLAQRGGTSTQLILTDTPTPPPTATEAAATPTTVRPTKAPVVTVTSTPAPATDTPNPVASLTSTPALPDDVVALAVVVVQGASRARVRDVPNGNDTVTAVSNGTEVQVLAGKVKINDITWLEIRVAEGDVGWMADYLLRITQVLP